jgi:hypothetical protein
MKFVSLILAAQGLVFASSALAVSPNCYPIGLSCFGQDPSGSAQFMIESSTCANNTQITVRGIVQGTPVNMTTMFDGGLWSLDTNGVAHLRSTQGAMPTQMTIWKNAGNFYAELSNYNGRTVMSCNRFQ